MKSIRSLYSAFLCLSLTLVPAHSALALTTTTAPMAVSATVLSICGVAATPLAFGNYSATNSSPTYTTATVTALCSSGVAYTISMDAGTGTGATVATRKMTSGLNTLAYTIYQDSGHSTIWGDGTNSTSTLAATSGLLPSIYTAYGSIAAAQQAPSGIYLDSVTVTLSY